MAVMLVCAPLGSYLPDSADWLLCPDGFEGSEKSVRICSWHTCTGKHVKYMKPHGQQRGKREAMGGRKSRK